MLNFIDNFLNRTTMYRLVLQVLIFFFVGALTLSFLGYLPYSPLYLLLSLIFILAVSHAVNFVFQIVYKSPTNLESVYISAFILFFIITPIQNGNYIEFLPLAFWGAAWAVASKYILAYKRKHIFNPVAIAVVICAFTINQAASWWVGTPAILPFVFLGGALIVRKIRRFDLILSYAIFGSIGLILSALMKGGNAASANSILNTLILTVKNSSFVFFISVMLTEPLTSPTTRKLRIAFGALVGILAAPTIHIGSIYSTPELALVVGNIFAFVVSPREKLFLKLKKRTEIGTDTYDFVFENEQTRKINFRPGQYMEWTLPQHRSDNRGNRRYFTLANSPTENEIRLGVKFYPDASTFKKDLLALPAGHQIVASQISGDFVMPKNKNKELVFIAGGIGITPFRSMVKYLIDKNEKRNIALLYSNKTVSDIVYADIFAEAERKLNIKTVYFITNKDEKILPGMKSGFINAETIQKNIPNFKNKIYYISGPQAMVTAFEKMLKQIGVPHKNVKVDYFPGFA